MERQSTVLKRCNQVSTDVLGPVKRGGAAVENVCTPSSLQEKCDRLDQRFDVFTNIRRFDRDDYIKSALRRAQVRV